MRNVVFLCVLLIVSSVFSPLSIAAADDSASIDPSQLHGTEKLEALIEVVTDRQKVMKSLRAKFEQTKSSDLLVDTSKATGVFTYLAPGRVLWNFQEPDPMKVAIADETVTTLHPKLKRAEQIKVSAQHKTQLDVLAGQINLDDMQSRFAITLVDSGPTEPYKLTLRPLRRVIKKRIDSIYVEVDRDLLLPVMVEYHEADGDSTRFVFSSIEIDSSIDPEIFELELGDDVEVDYIDASSGQG